MLKGEDIVLMLKLAANPGVTPTVRELETETSIARSVVQRALKRLIAAGLFDSRKGQVRRAQTEEFLIHGVPYVFPVSLGGETRGIATAWGASPLAEEIALSRNDPSPVWPTASGQLRGPALAPLHSAVPRAAVMDPALAELLVLTDAIRAGDARIRGVASRLLSDRLATPVP